jgi:hypothetical protein
MSTDVLRLPGNYKIEAKSTSSNSITLDSPFTIITGQLTVLGSSTNFISTNTTISDNILTLNSGETNNFVTLGLSGLLIARGNNDSPDNAATFLYNDNTSTGGVWTIGTLTNRGIFEFKVANEYSGIKTTAVRVGVSDTTLNIFGSDNPLAVLSVAGTHNYEDQVIDDDDIPNKKYVDSSLREESQIARKLKVGNTFIELNSNDVLISDEYYNSSEKMLVALGTSTNIVLELQGTSAIFSGLTINNNEIITNTTNTNIILDPNGTGNVVVKGALQILNTLPPSPVSFQTAVYSTSTIGGGGTGLYYVNTVDTDELVSRRRAIIYGIIF